MLSCSALPFISIVGNSSCFFVDILRYEFAKVFVLPPMISLFCCSKETKAALEKLSRFLTCFGCDHVLKWGVRVHLFLVEMVGKYYALLLPSHILGKSSAMMPCDTNCRCAQMDQSPCRRLRYFGAALV